MSNITRRERADAIRFLSMDAVQKANSGHPGMPMGMADIAEVLWHDFLKHNPLNPNFPNRDRFILSNGHGSMLLYALLHLTGYDLTIEDLKKFRQLHSKTPGHPEHAHTPGVETTTGPLGQGIANAVGMAIAEKHMGAIFNRPGYALVDHFTYCFIGDGCLMEGLSHESCSLAGTLGLGKLIVIYDDNGISIDGDTAGWFNDNTPERFRAYNWHVIPNINGHDSDAIKDAILKAQGETTKPSLLCCKTTIGWGAPNLAGTADTHGAALGENEVAATRMALNWAHQPFVIAEETYASWSAIKQGKYLEDAWQKLFADYQKTFPELAKEFIRRLQARLPEDWAKQNKKFIKDLNTKQTPMATRKASQLCLNYYAEILPEMIGGSADLTESNCTNWQGMTLLTKSQAAGRYIHYGVREFGMSAIMNGMALYKGILPFGGTFLTFSDYARNAIRMAAIMQQRVIFVYTHDSIGLGEDGPTHQPIEHISSLRMIPGLSLWRPCDTVETAVAWHMAIERQGPTCLLFSRQNLPCQTRTDEEIEQIKRGGYVLLDCARFEELDAVLIATGSEVSLAIDVANKLKAENIFVRVVSMPSQDTFLKQDDSFKESVLPDSLQVRIAIEAATGIDWYRFVGTQGKVFGLNHFGFSAPAKDVFQACGFTVENICSITKSAIHQATSIPAKPAKCATLNGK